MVLFGCRTTRFERRYDGPCIRLLPATSKEHASVSNSPAACKAASTLTDQCCPRCHHSHNKGFVSMGALSGEVENPSKVMPLVVLVLMPMLIFLNIAPLAAAWGLDSNYTQCVSAFRSSPCPTDQPVALETMYSSSPACQINPLLERERARKRERERERSRLHAPDA